MSSSPGLPSLSELLKKPPTLRSGSRVSPIPTTANASFTSASTLLKTARSIESIQSFRAPTDLDKQADEPAAKPKARKIRAKKAIESDDIAAEKKPAQTKRKKAEPKKDDDTMVKEKVARKPRAKKDESKTQPKLAKARVTKSSGISGIDTKKKKTLAPDMATEMEIRTPLQIPSTALFLDTPLDKDGVPKLRDSLLDTGFSSLMNDFGYKNGEDSKQENHVKNMVLDLPSIKKRKSPEISKKDVAVKAKPARKKAKTITDQATAAYVTDITEVELAKRPGAITDFFGYESKDVDLDGPNIPKSKPPKPLRLKPGEKGRPILLSPKSAMKDINQQDILFGTSSQLARENSPTLLRDLDQAMRDSNSMNNDLFPDFSNDSSELVNTSHRIRSRVGRSNLWSASSRDQSGELMNIEIVDLSVTPVAKVMSAHLSTDDEHAIESIRMPAEPNNGAKNPKNLDTRILDVSDFEDTMGRTIVQETVESSNIVKQKPIVDNPVKAPKPNPSSSKPKALTKTRKAKQVIPTEKPDYSTYTNEQLTKAVAAFGFKVVKKREQMIILLNKCWESQHVAQPSNDIDGEETNTLLTAKPSEQPERSMTAVVQTAQTSPLKKPRGRPKKIVEGAPSLPVSKPIAVLKPNTGIRGDEGHPDSEDIPLILRRTPQKQQKKSKKTMDCLEEMLDSDTAPTPSPRRKGSKKKVSALPLIPAYTPDSSDTEAPSQAEIFHHITKAIKSAPPSTSSSDPNWYEKMLLYDPIVLEDLTIWLNTGGFERVGWDGEVCPAEVKTWCESNSVCCLMRENLRGGARSRY